MQHVNELSYNIDLEKVLKKAEAIYIQVKTSEKLTNELRQIMGLPLAIEEIPIVTTALIEQVDSLKTNQNVIENGCEAIDDKAEEDFETAISNNYL